MNGDKLPKFVVFWTISTINNEKAAAKFHCITSSSAMAEGPRDALSQLKSCHDFLVLEVATCTANMKCLASDDAKHFMFAVQVDLSNLASTRKSLCGLSNGNNKNDLE